MTAIRFAAFKGISWISKLIRWWTRGDYSHIAFWSDDGRLIGAWGKWKKKWQFYDMHEHKKGTPYEIWELVVDPAQMRQIMQTALLYAQMGIPYDYRGVLGFVFKNRDSRKRIFCSEGCMIALQQAGFLRSIEPWRVYPSLFVELIQLIGARKIREGVV